MQINQLICAFSLFHVTYWFTLANFQHMCCFARKLYLHKRKISAFYFLFQNGTEYTSALSLSIELGVCIDLTGKLCKCQYKNVQKVENKNVHFIPLSLQTGCQEMLAFP